MGSIPLRIRVDEIVRFIKLMMELDNGYYLVGGMMKFVVRLNILWVKNVVLKIALIIILQESEYIHIILYLLKKYWLFKML